MFPLQKALILGFTTAAVGIALLILPATRTLEQHLGLTLLFKLRGQRPAPADVLIVTLDNFSSKQLQLPPKPEDWPRGLHARLINTLSAQGVKAIVFDLHFKDCQEDDPLFAEAMREAGNVILCETLTAEHIQKGLLQAQIETRQPPVSPLSRSALAFGPFPLPKIPVKVSQYWTFKTSAGNIPTLPVITFHVFARDYYPDFFHLLESAAPQEAHRIRASAYDNEIRTIQNLRELFQSHSSLPAKMLKALKSQEAFLQETQRGRVLRSLINMYKGPENPFLNYYGPPGTITTLPYCRLITGKGGHSTAPAGIELEDKVVFVGLSENLRPQQQDGFYTVFSMSSGIHISGVEIAATAFANLLEDRHIRFLPPAWNLSLICLWGLLVGLLCRVFPPLQKSAGLTILCIAYLAGALHMFAVHQTWLPMVIPLFIQTPLAYFTSFVLVSREAKKDKEEITRTAGKYLPPEIVEQLRLNKKADADPSRIVYGTCLLTDAGRYTTLSERLPPEELNKYMNNYYELLFKPVKENEGSVVNIVGDSMLALWTSPSPEVSVKKKACLAAIGITRGLNGQHALFSDLPLDTRIGIHSGEIFLGDVGAMDHYEYRPIGDIINTASRLEGLNKFLGTRTLVSKTVFEQMEDFLFRRMGIFLLAGKSSPLEVFELICLLEKATARQKEICKMFTCGLQAYQQGAFAEASRYFNRILQHDDRDGPSRRYHSLCRQLQQNPPIDHWDGVIHVKEK